MAPDSYSGSGTSTGTTVVDSYDKDHIADTVKLKLMSAKKIRVQWEAWVATVENFFQGRHREWWTEQGTLIRKPLADGEIWRQINLFPGFEDIRQNRLTKNDPHWHVKQSYGIVASPEDLDVANAYLQGVYRDQKWKDAMKKIIAHGDKRGACPVVVGWDDDANQPTLTYYDSWDFYPDPTGSGPADWWWLICSVPKSLDEIKQREDFDQDAKDKVQAENRYAQSGLKDMIERARRGGQLPSDQTILNQFFVRTKDGIMQYYVVGDTLMRSGVLLPYKSFDEFIDLYKPRDTDHFYERPPCSDWVDLQKTINKLMSNAEAYCDMMLQGRWRRLDKTISIPVGGQHGQVIDAAIGDLEQYPLIPLPQTHFQVLDRAVAHMEQIAGVHGESMGRLSGSADSGVSITALQAGDEQNSATAVDNFKSFLSRIAVKALTVASKNLKISTPIFVEQTPGDSIRIDVIGEEFRTLRDMKNVYGIKPFSNIDVEIVVGSAYSDFQQQQTVLDLLKVGYQPGQNPVLDRLVVTFWRMGNQREVMKMLEDFRDPDRMIAAAENFKMRNGAFIAPQASDNHQVHIGIHVLEQKRMQSVGDMQAMKNVTNHIEEHRQLLDAKRTQLRDSMSGNVPGNTPPNMQPPPPPPGTLNPSAGAPPVR